MPPRLVIFDVDGTLVDSQADILASARAGFASVGLEPPDRAAILSIVGLSLPVAIAQLTPGVDDATRAAIVAGYRGRFRDLKDAPGAFEAPLYPHVAEVLAELHADPAVVMGVATGKSRRGLDRILDRHGIRDHFVTLQCADDHPSKPDPAMLRAALAETGVAAGRAVMVGDTSYDMEMARAAGIRAVGVRWGYHEDARLGAADVLIGDMRDLIGVLEDREIAG